MNIKRLNWIKSGMAVGLVLSGINMACAFRIGSLGFVEISMNPPQVYVSAYDNPDITEVIIPDTVVDEGIKYAVTKIEGFINCPNLVSIYLPKTIKDIQYPIAQNFLGYNSPNFVRFEVAEDNPWFSAVDGVLYSKNLKELIFCPYGKKQANIRDGVVTIKRYAFANRPLLESVSVPESVFSIEEGAFYNCTALPGINFSSNLKYIGKSAFSGCSALKMDLVLDLGIENIREGAFDSCRSLKSLTYLASTPTLPSKCFQNCSSLQSVEIGSGVTYIDNSAFSSCWRLETVELSESVTGLGSGVFSDCPALKNFFIPEANSALMSENDIIYNKEKSKLYCGPGVVGSLTVPESIVEIAGGAFMDNTMLTEITFPSSLLKINGKAFYNCKSLKQITCLSETPPELGPSAFDYDDLKNVRPIPATVYVPDKVLEKYRDSYYWQEFRDRIYGISESKVEDAYSAEETFYEVFSLDGRQVLKAASRDELRRLERGIYIVNGKKMAL